MRVNRVASPGKSKLALAGQFIWRLTTAIVRHDIASLAAVIAFYAAFSLFPLLILLIYSITLFIPNTHVESVLLSLVRPYFPALPEAKEFISSNIARLSEMGGNFGLISAVTLTWSATSGFIAVQQALDVIWESSQRSYLARRLIAFSMLVVLLLLTVVSAIVMALPSVVNVNLGLLAHARVLRWFTFIHGISRVMFPLTLFLGSLVLYRALPAKSLSWVYLVPGALITTIALDVGRELFVWYASHLMRYQLIYGNLLAAVMLLVLWMYIASIVMLFGAEVSRGLYNLVTEDY